MGYIAHHAIVVTSWDDKTLKAAHDKAIEIGCAVSKIVDSKINSYRSFLIAPDGSKEGWGDSDSGDQKRKEWIEWAESTLYEDNSGPLSWVEIRYGSDDQDAVISNHAWKVEA